MSSTSPDRPWAEWSTPAARIPGTLSSSKVGERLRRPEDGAAIFNVPVMTLTLGTADRGRGCPLRAHIARAT